MLILYDNSDNDVNSELYYRQITYIFKINKLKLVESINLRFDLLDYL